MSYDDITLLGLKYKHYTETLQKITLILVTTLNKLTNKYIETFLSRTQWQSSVGQDGVYHCTRMQILHRYFGQLWQKHYFLYIKL